ncbi:hypothetical protein C8Q70DRAFT_910292 [Cubamyces menziesii]|nr:hypothetical protein C8Q70DRAFT_910292 [Cubamyces menziesii]
MSCAVASPTSATSPFVPRKRTMSFSTPTPNKSARTSLRRTGSYLSLADMQTAEYTPLYGNSGPTKSFTASDSLVIGQYDYRMRSHKRRTTPSRSSSIHIVAPSPSPKPSSQILILTSRRTTSRPRTSSPLAPVRRTLGELPSMPCTKKREPDLYRTAIETRMRMSPVGRNILHMGPRVALSIISATEALENLVASQRDGEVSRGGDSALSASWVDLSQEDWEMVDQSL